MKKIISIVLVFLLTLSLSGTAFAEAQLYYVTDAADILSDEEDLALEELAQSVSQQYQCGIYLVIVDDYGDFGFNPDNAADNIYAEYTLGYGDTKDGILLLLSMAERDYAMLAHGFGETAFTSYGLDIVSNAFLDAFSRNAWAEGFEQYINTCGELLAQARNGVPLDSDSDPTVRAAGVGVSILLGLALAAIICFALKSSMRSVAAKSEAGTYVTEGGIDIYEREEHYTHSTQVRTKVSSSSRSGGGSRKSGKF